MISTWKTNETLCGPGDKLARCSVFIVIFATVISAQTVVNVGLPGTGPGGSDDRILIQNALNSGLAATANNFDATVLFPTPPPSSPPYVYTIASTVTSTNQDLTWHLLVDYPFSIPPGSPNGKLTILGSQCHIRFLDRSACGLGLVNLNSPTLSDLTFDYASLPFTQGKIVALDSVLGSYIDVEIENGYPHPFVTSQQAINPPDAYFNPTTTSLNSFNLQLLFYDAATRGLLSGSEQYNNFGGPTNSSISMSSIPNSLNPGGNDILRLSFAPTFPLSPSYFQQKLGDLVTIRMYPTVGSYAIRAANCLHPQFNSVTILNSIGQGMFFRQCQQTEVNSCRIVPDQGSQALLSSNRDAILSVNGLTPFPDSSGIVAPALTVDHCMIAACGDDAISMYTVAGTITSTSPASNSVFSNDAIGSYEFLHGVQSQFINPKIEVFDPVSFSSKGVFSVSAVDHVNGRITLLEPLPMSIVVGDLIVPQWSSHQRARITNNTVIGNRGRGVFLAALDAVVQNNSFSDCLFSSILLGVERIASPLLPFSRNALISGNVIQHSAYSVRDRSIDSAAPAGIALTAITTGPNWPTSAGHDNVAILQNVVDQSGGSSIFIASATGVTIAGNILTNSHQYSSTLAGSAIGLESPFSAALHFQNCDSLTIANNFIESTPSHTMFNISSSATGLIQVANTSMNSFTFEPHETLLNVDASAGPLTYVSSPMSGPANLAWSSDGTSWNLSSWFVGDLPGLMNQRQFIYAYQDSASAAFSPIASVTTVAFDMSMTSVLLQSPLPNSSVSVQFQVRPVGSNSQWTTLCQVSNDSSNAFQAFVRQTFIFGAIGAPFAASVPSGALEVRFRLVINDFTSPIIVVCVDSIHIVN